MGAHELSYAQLQHDVEALARHLGLDRVSIVGFSDGGTVAYRLCSAGNMRVDELVTIGACGA